MHHLIVDDFMLPEVAHEMRRQIEAHFMHSNSPQTHQVWNYWHIPGQYTYLRTNPEKVLERELVDRFMQALKAWSAEQLGTNDATWPYLSLYVNGCRQGVHNDALNGRFGFVYSLTANGRKSLGGETLLFHQGERLERCATRAAAGLDFHEIIEPRFNRLLVFDDRVPHAVEAVQGPMDPLQGRFVLHGHLRGGSPAPAH